MYADHFGLKEMPFNISPDPRFLFMTAQHNDAIERSMYVVNDKRGLVAIHGDIGMGKTTIARRLLQLIEDTPKTEVGMLITPALNTKQALLRALMAEFGVPQKRSYDLSLMAFQDYIIARANQGMNMVAIIDEAQELTPKMLGVIHTLLNFESNTQKFLQIVLIGQNELATNLDKVPPVKSRVAVFGRLEGLTYDDTKEMIAFRWAIASANKSSDPFSTEAVERIYAYSRGLPREINKLCHESLIIAASEGSESVSEQMIDETAKDLRLKGEK